MSKFNFEQIDKAVISAALDQYFFNSLVELNNLKHSSGQLKREETLDFFMGNFMNELSFYKQDKKSGYDVIVLYKNTSMVYVIDFYCSKAKELEIKLPETKEWLNDATREFSRAFLAANYKGNPCDLRTRYHRYKESAIKMVDEALLELSRTE